MFRSKTKIAGFARHGKASKDAMQLYNKGVIALSEHKIKEAITIFEEISDTHPSAAYNLGIIYLDGGGVMLPDFRLAKHYLSLAQQQGHTKASDSMLVLQFQMTGNSKQENVAEYFSLLPLALYQFIEAGQIGNLAYLIAQDAINVINTSSQSRYTFNRFIDYEVWCIRNYANEEVRFFYEQSRLVHWGIQYADDWNNQDMAVLSDYINSNAIQHLQAESNGKFNPMEAGVMRLAMVNHVHQYYLE